MSVFYGTLRGNRNAVTRTGSKNSGVEAAVQSWDGSVITRLDYIDDKLNVRINVAKGSSSYSNDCIFSGTIEELTAKLRG